MHVSVGYQLNQTPTFRVPLLRRQSLQADNKITVLRQGFGDAVLAEISLKDRKRHLDDEP
jgi:hypothetical protein